MNSDAAVSNENRNRAKQAIESLIEKYFFQLTQGCGRADCSNAHCASNPRFERLTHNQAAAEAIQLVKSKAALCSQSTTTTGQNGHDDHVQPTTSTKASPHPIAKSRPSNSNNNNDSGDDDDGDDDDDSDVIVSNASSMLNMRSNAPVSSADNMKSLNEALADAVNYVSSSQASSSLSTQSNASNSSSSSGSGNKKKQPYLSESRIISLLNKCKRNAATTTTQATKMEVDNDDEEAQQQQQLIGNYMPLIGLVQSVFQSYKSLAMSFRSHEYDSAERLVCVDYDAMRGAYSLLFSSSNDEALVGELERQLDLAVYALCVSIRMLLKKPSVVDASSSSSSSSSWSVDMRHIVHSLLVVNELPLLEEPKYMERCAKIFYAAWSELPLSVCVPLVRHWSTWPSGQLRTLVDKLQQYITVCVVSRRMASERGAGAGRGGKRRPRSPDADDDDADDDNDDDDDDEDDEDEDGEKSARRENQRTFLHKHEGIAGAVALLRLVYYASIVGGRLDSPEQIARERQLERAAIEQVAATDRDQMSNMFGSGSTAASSSSSSSGGGNELNTSRADPLEEALGIRPIDCREAKLPAEQFVNDVANKYIDMQHDYVEYIQQVQLDEQQAYSFTKASSSSSMGAGRSRTRHFSFLAHPFFLVLAKKNLGLFYDNKVKMMRERRHNIMMSLFHGDIPNPYFRMRLTRSSMLVDALSLIELQEQEDPSILRKQLVIEFENELGIDQGGVSKEFFQLAIDDLLHKGYTFFTYDEKSRYYWFTPCTLETAKEFRLIGILFGIAIYNSVLLDVQFPPVFFRKLMGKLGTFDDLKYSHPPLYSTLQSLLEFNGSDEEFEATFMLTFQISLTDNFESTVTFNLKPDGDNIPVTKQNRQEFVELYADFMLNKGIEESFEAFRSGFLKMVMNSPLSKWYLPEELEILLCGSKVLDWESLENSTMYDSGFDDNHQFIKKFWSVFHSFTAEEKKLFLKFTTGTDRCPHGGLAKLKLTIARNGPDTDKLPTAHTCFNVLLLPEYANEQKLKEKLLKAIQYSRGFGLS